LQCVISELLGMLPREYNGEMYEMFIRVFDTDWDLLRIVRASISLTELRVE